MTNPESRPEGRLSAYLGGMDEREFMKSLYILARTFVHGEVWHREHIQAIEARFRGRRARITHLVDIQTLEIAKIDLINCRVYDRDRSLIELNDPRSIPVAIRVFCRLLGQDIPSFEAVDEALKTDPPYWWVEEFEQASLL